MSQERWDVVLKVLNGPMAAMGEQVFRGPVVRIGAAPGPGGLKLSGYRGLDARQCVITAYDGGTVSVAPVGTNQIRMAPHPHVNWKEIDPMGGPTFLNEGCALHLGPVGRGATMEFVKAQRLGVWTTGALSSEAEAVQSMAAGKQATGGAPIPQAIDARKVGTVSATKVPIWFLGCLFLMSISTVVVILAVILIRGRAIAPLGPKEDGQSHYEFVTLDEESIPPQLSEGLHQAWHDFIAKPNADLSGSRRLVDPANWDQRFYDYVTASVNQHLSAWNVFRRLEIIKDDYGHVVAELARAELPEVFAGVPYQESLYDPSQQSHACAKGYWQFMPELAHRLNTRNGLDFRVKDCRFQDAPGVLWSPQHLAPPRVRDREYLSQGKCRIPKERGCKIDDRTDIDKSTTAAIFALREAWDDRTIAASGAAVEITILSHNAGYDDSRYGYKRKTNLLPAYKAWKSTVDPSDTHRFYGENLRCDTPEPEGGGRCGSHIPAETQHYAYRIVAVHMLAACYYGLNYGEKQAFKKWIQYTRGDGYCTKLNVPTSQEVQSRRGKRSR